MSTPPSESELTPKQLSQFTPIIDEILKHADLQTISVKRTIVGLQDQLGYDISQHKTALKKLIGERFDYISSSQTEPQSQSQASESFTKSKVESPSIPVVKPEPAKPAIANGSTPSRKRPSPSSSISDSLSPPPSKKPKTAAIKGLHNRTKTMEDLDAEFAARLQAEEMGRARSTRGGGTASSAVIKKRQGGTPVKKNKKRKSKATLSDEDSGLDGTNGVEKEKKERKGGFHKPLMLGNALAELLNETMLPRPEVVKRLWVYIKENELQDPKDKRTIICDDALKKVFKIDKVTMFSMNKHLSLQLYSPEE